MKKGFTLIELLAVIVIVAIITLIATPIISNVVNNSKVGALKNSAYGLLEASNLYYAQNGSKGIRFDINDNIVTSNDTTKLLNYKGNIKRGTVIIDKKGNTTICITDGTNSAYKNYNDNDITTVTKETCNIPSSSSIVYLESSGATITELTNKQLTDKITELEAKLALKADQSDLDITNNNVEMVATLANNAATKNELATIDDEVYRLVKVSQSAMYTSTASLTYTGVSFTIPANVYYSLTGKIAWNHGEAKSIAILSSTSRGNATGNYCNNSDTANGNGSKFCVISGYTGDAAETVYLWGQNSNGTSNYAALYGYYFTK